MIKYLKRLWNALWDKTDIEEMPNDFAAFL